MAGNELVQRLSEGEHPVEISLRPEKNLRAFQECVERGYVHVKFTDTRGGTELGVAVDVERSGWQGEDFKRGSGSVRIVGNLTLNYEKVRCVAEIQLPALSGVGHLERLEGSEM